MSTDTKTPEEIADIEVITEEAGQKKEELSAEEKAFIEKQRISKQIVKNCNEEIAKVLQKHKCVLNVDKSSPIGAPRIIIQLGQI